MLVCVDIVCPSSVELMCLTESPHSLRHSIVTCRKEVVGVTPSLSLMAFSADSSSQDTTTGQYVSTYSIVIEVGFTHTTLLLTFQKFSLALSHANGEVWLHVLCTRDLEIRQSVRNEKVKLFRCALL